MCRGTRDTMVIRPHPTNRQYYIICQKRKDVRCVDCGQGKVFRLGRGSCVRRASTDGPNGRDGNDGSDGGNNLGQSRYVST